MIKYSKSVGPILKKDLRSYKQACKEANRAVRDAKTGDYDDCYARLDSKDGGKNIYKLAKLREKKTRDFPQVHKR